MGAINLANRLTLLRILLVPFFVACLLYYSPGQDFFLVVAIILFIVACATDGIDGYLARKMNQTTRLGSYMDPVADKLLLLSGFLSLSWMTHLPAGMHVPAWLTLAVLSRDVLILTGAMVIFIATGKLIARPMLIGKVTTVAQMAALLFSLLELPWNFRAAFYCLAAVLTVISGAYYIRMGGQMFQENL